MFTFLGLLCVLAIVGLGVFLNLKVDFKQETAHFSFKTFVPFLVGAFIVFVVLMGCVQVSSGSRAVVTHFGNPVAELNPGMHWINPVTSTLVPIAVQSRIVKTNEEAGSKDLQIVGTEVTLRYHLDPAYVTYFWTKLNNDAEERVVKPSVLESIKAVTAQYDAQELLSKRAEVRDKMELAIEAKLSSSHIVADQTSITGFSFSPEYNHAIEQKVTALQQAEKAKNDLIRIQTEAQQKEAEADGQAKAKIANAKGEAEALSIQRNQITPELLQLRTIEMLAKNWDGKLPATVISGSGGSPVPFLDVLKASGK